MALSVKVGETPSVKLLVSPRVGFNWYADKEHNTLVRGGLGIFTGRVPFVWMLNAYNNNGVELKHYYVSRNTVPTVGETINDLKGATETLSASSEVIQHHCQELPLPTSASC